MRTLNFRLMQIDHAFNEIFNKRSYEQCIQFQILVPQNVNQTAFSTIFADNANA